jgi:hypothetical protein
VYSSEARGVHDGFSDDGWGGLGLRCSTNGGREYSFSALQTGAQAARELPRYLVIECFLSIIAPKQTN